MKSSTLMQLSLRWKLKNQNQRRNYGNVRVSPTLFDALEKTEPNQNLRKTSHLRPRASSWKTLSEEQQAEIFNSKNMTPYSKQY